MNKSQLGIQLSGSWIREIVPASLQVEGSILNAVQDGQKSTKRDLLYTEDVPNTSFLLPVLKLTKSGFVSY